MPSLLHEALIELFRAQPALAAQLYCASQGLPPPGALQVQLAEAELGQLAPPQYRADAVLSLSGTLCMDLILEVQLGIDPDKAGVWAVYVAVQYDRSRRPVALLVLALDPKVAEWARRPIVMGPGSVVQPIVVGPDQIPRITDPVRARACPELGVLSALAHGQSADAERIGEAAILGVLGLDEDHCRVYTDLVMGALNPLARAALEKLMFENWEPQSDFLRNLDARALERGRAQGVAQGVAQGERALLCRLLTRRFGALPSWAQARLEQADPAQLERWGDTLLTADSLEQLLGSPG